MKKRILLIAMLAMCCNAAQADLVWQPAPAEEKPQSAMMGHVGHGGHGGGKPYLLQNAAGAEAEMWLPTRVRRPLHVGDDGRVSVKGTGVTSYHLLFARKSSATSEEVAMRYISQRGKPSGESPASLVNAGKSTLGITPAPLTREHQRYTSGKGFDFLVSFKGKALVSHKVMLTTSNGSIAEASSDAQGRVTFRLPDDFVDVQPGRSNNRPADFVVAVAHETGGKDYRTTLSAPYYVNPAHWQSTTGGLLAMFAGMVTGLLVLRRSRNSAADDKQGRG